MAMRSAVDTPCQPGMPRLRATCCIAARMVVARSPFLGRLPTKKTAKAMLLRPFFFHAEAPCILIRIRAQGDLDEVAGPDPTREGGPHLLGGNLQVPLGGAERFVER